MDLRVQIQIFILSILGSICFLIVLFSQLVDYQSKLRKKTLVSIELATALLMVADVFANIYRGDSSVFGFWMVRISNFLTFFLIYIELIELNRYIGTYVKNQKEIDVKVEKIITIISYVGMALLVISQFTDSYYFFDENNRYMRGPLFVVSFIMPLFIIVVMMISILKKRKAISVHIMASGIVFTFLPLLCAILQAFVTGISFFNISIGCSAIIMFALSLVEQNEYLRRIASIEKMTGLPNSHGYILELERKIARKEITKYNALYFDIVRMGLINRKYGNAIGDQVIVKYSRAVREFMEPDEILGRLGGNFFVAVIRKENTEKFLEFISGVEVHIQTPGGAEIVKISAVTGIYEVSSDDIEADQIMTNVSMAVNIAKNIKKRPYVYLTQQLMQEMHEQRQLQEMIPKSMARKEFVAYYQPKVSLSNHTLCGAEALARWKHEGEIVSPFRFISLMEQNESICKFDFYMLHTVCADIKGWLEQGLTPPTISVNFSRKNLGNPILAEEIYNVVKSYDIPCSLVQIEVTETVDEYPIEYLKGVVEALQRYGMTAAIDDFGTGSSSIKILKEVPFDVLKIDKSFIDSISVKDKHILAHIIGMANEMGASIITEGVETKEQIDVLKELGCGEIQGYYFDKPLSKEVFEDRINNPVYA